MTPLHVAITNGRARLLISEHPDCCSISSHVDGAGILGFYTPAQLIQIEAACRNIRRRIQRRAG